MRSRYTAHALGDEAYLHRTYARTAARPYVVGRKRGSPVSWVRLIVHEEQGGATADLGIVEFSAFYRDDAGEHEMRERSEFRRIQGEWLYTRAV